MPPPTARRGPGQIPPAAAPLAAPAPSHGPPGRLGPERRPPAGELPPALPERELHAAQRRPLTPKERFEALQAPKRRAELDTKIAELDQRIQNGLVGPGHMPSQADMQWLNDPNFPERKRLAYDNDKLLYSVQEARDAEDAVSDGVVVGPVRRSFLAGHDWVDGTGKHWSHKGTGPGSTVAGQVALVVQEAGRDGRPCIASLGGTYPIGDAWEIYNQVRRELRDLRRQGIPHAEVRFMPSTIPRIRKFP